MNKRLYVITAFLLCFVFACEKVEELPIVNTDLANPTSEDSYKCQGCPGVSNPGSIIDPVSDLFLTCEVPPVNLSCFTPEFYEEIAYAITGQINGSILTLRLKRNGHETMNIPETAQVTWYTGGRPSLCSSVTSLSYVTGNEYNITIDIKPDPNSDGILESFCCKVVNNKLVFCSGDDFLLCGGASNLTGNDDDGDPIGGTAALILPQGGE